MSDASEYDAVDRLLHPDDHVKAENLRVDGGGAVEAAAAVLAVHWQHWGGCRCGWEPTLPQTAAPELRLHIAAAIVAAGLLATSGRAGGDPLRKVTAVSYLDRLALMFEGDRVALARIASLRGALGPADDSPADSGTGGGGGG